MKILGRSILGVDCNTLNSHTVCGNCIFIMGIVGEEVFTNICIGVFTAVDHALCRIII